MNPIEPSCNRFGFPERSGHVCEGASIALIRAARTVEQLNLAIETISRCEQAVVKVAPRPAVSKEITPACKKMYEDLAAHGSADEVLKVAKISRYFREHYLAAVKWANKEKRQTPINA